MKSTIKTWSIVILTILGGFQVLSWVINVAPKIDALYDSSANYEMRQNKYEDIAERAYKTGRLWGRAAAEGYELSGQNVDERRAAAAKILSSRSFDNYCWGADDCGDLPTNDQISTIFGTVEFGSKNMPNYAFRSGFIDSYVENTE
ncbi:hypothetical protein [Paenibacillus montanisoli]|uniref:Uncharacterized protein n=1 Tax=Paenibacillus montanisoli TaxID=2081970 RepID=A0A328TV17_9BACL|nr:hypothetical protein [Paenibacillus montanisoli]RAP74379.1 hypothetical protein DL346_20065 [Paenibacillus montanisoli]